MKHMQIISRRQSSGVIANIGFAIDRISDGPIALSLFVAMVAVLLCVNLLDFPLSVPYMNRISGQDYLDMQRFYTSEDAYRLLDAFPQRLDFLANMTGLLTLTKSVLYLITILMILPGFGYRIYTYRQSGKVG